MSIQQQPLPPMDLRYEDPRFSERECGFRQGAWLYHRRTLQEEADGHRPSGHKNSASASGSWIGADRAALAAHKERWVSYLDERHGVRHPVSRAACTHRI